MKIRQTITDSFLQLLKQKMPFFNEWLLFHKEDIDNIKEIEKDELSHFYYLDRLSADVEIGKEVGWEFEEEYNKRYGK